MAVSARNSASRAAGLVLEHSTRRAFGGDGGIEARKVGGGLGQRRVVGAEHREHRGFGGRDFCCERLARGRTETDRDQLPAELALLRAEFCDKLGGARQSAQNLVLLAPDVAERFFDRRQRGGAGDHRHHRVRAPPSTSTV